MPGGSFLAVLREELPLLAHLFTLIIYPLNHMWIHEFKRCRDTVNTLLLLKELITLWLSWVLKNIAELTLVGPVRKIPKLTLLKEFLHSRWAWYGIPPRLICTLDFACMTSYDFMYNENNTLESAPYFSLNEEKLIPIKCRSGRHIKKKIQTIVFFLSLHLCLGVTLFTCWPFSPYHLIHEKIRFSC